MSPEIAHPVELAADRLDELDPAYVARVVDELHAGPLTTERVHQAVNELAGLGTVVQVRTLLVMEVDGVWCAAGITPWGRHVWYPIPDETLAQEIGDAQDRGDHPVVPVAPTALFDLSPDVLGEDARFADWRDSP